MTPALFRWETLRIIEPCELRFREPVRGVTLEVELVTRNTVRVFRADDGEFYFCHGLTFGGKDAPGGAISPFSGAAVATILDEMFVAVAEGDADEGDILVWRDTDGYAIHSAALVKAIKTGKADRLDYRSTLRSKNGALPEREMTLDELVMDDEAYGESYSVYRRK
jgi:hypothetical protein